MDRKRGFTLIEVLIALAMFSMAAVVVFTVFISQNNSIEIQGRETFLYEEIDRGIHKLSDRMRGTKEILPFKSDDGDEVLLRFKYYHRDNENIFEGKLYTKDEEGQKTLRLAWEKDGGYGDLVVMKNLDEIEVEMLDQNGEITEERNLCCGLKINYKVSLKYRKMKREKEGTTVINMRNMKS